MNIFDPLHLDLKPGWYRWLQGFMQEFGDYGGSVLLLPSPTRTHFDGPTSTGLRYDPISSLDIGQWDELQPGRGSDAQALVQLAARHGVSMLIDVPGQFGAYPVVERNAAGKPDKTLAYLPPAVFNAKEDGTFEDGADDGLQIDFEYSKPQGYVLAVRLQTLHFLMNVFGARGFRQDKAKDIWPAASRRYGKLGLVIGEYWDGANAGPTNYCNTTGNCAYDFGSHYAYSAIAKGQAGLDALVYQDRLCHAWPDRAVIFVDNHDTDPSGDVPRAKGWFYFDAATQAARAWQTFGKDYWDYGLAPLIRNYMWIHARLAWGAQKYLIVSKDVLVWSRDGNGGKIGQSAGLICGISTDPLSTRWVWVDTHWASCWIVNYAVSGGPTVWVYADGRACIPLPPNQYDRCDNAVAYSLTGQGGAIHTKALTLKLTDPLDFSSLTARYVA